MDFVIFHEQRWRLEKTHITYHWADTHAMDFVVFHEQRWRL